MRLLHQPTKKAFTHRTHDDEFFEHENNEPEWKPTKVGAYTRVCCECLRDILADAEATGIANAVGAEKIER